MINQVGFSMPSYSANKISFKENARETKVDTIVREASIIDFSDRRGLSHKLGNLRVTLNGSTPEEIRDAAALVEDENMKAHLIRSADSYETERLT